MWKKKRFWFVYAPLTILVLFAADEMKDRPTPAELAACASISEDELIAIAARRFVGNGEKYRISQDGKREINPFPYADIEDLKRKNPGCCRVLPRISRDYPFEVQRLGAPYQNPPKAYDVQLEFFIARPGGNKKKYDGALVDCLGYAGSGPEAISKWSD